MTHEHPPSPSLIERLKADRWIYSYSENPQNVGPDPLALEAASHIEHLEGENAGLRGSIAAREDLKSIGIDFDQTAKEVAMMFIRQADRAEFLLALMAAVAEENDAWRVDFYDQRDQRLAAESLASRYRKALEEIAEGHFQPEARKIARQALGDHDV